MRGERSCISGISHGVIPLASLLCSSLGNKVIAVKMCVKLLGPLHLRQQQQQKGNKMENEIEICKQEREKNAP